MAGECHASPEAVAPAQNCAGAAADGARPSVDAGAATHPKTTGQDPMGEAPSAAPAADRGRSSVPIAGGAPATPAPPALMADAEHG